MKTVFTNGCFDIIHRGHIDYLTEAKKLGDRLIVGLNSDLSVAKLKGRGRPINNQEDRAEVLRALRFVDEVIIFDEETPKKLIRSLKPNVLVKGGDWTIETIVGHEIVQGYGGEVYALPFTEGHSTTDIIKKIREEY